MLFKEVTLTGPSPYERGLQYGKACREEIAVSIQCYKDLFQSRKQLSWMQACSLAQRYLSAIRASSENLLEEMQGIADGSGFLFDEILAINCRSELLHTPITADADEPQECTAFAFMAPATENGTVLAGQNWDFARLLRGAVVILRIPCGSTTLLMFAEAGMVGAMGVNSAGLCLTLNAMSTTSYGNGIPLRVRMRRILECSTLAAGYAEAVRGPIPAAANLIITHKDGLALELELDPAGINVLMPENGVLVHTNHFLGAFRPSSKPSASASSYIRLQRMQQLFCGKTGLTANDIKAALQDHKGAPLSICRHSTNSGPYTVADSATNFGFIADLTNGTVELAAGNPCEVPFRTICIAE